MEIKLIDAEKNLYIFQNDLKNYIIFSPSRGGIITQWILNSNSILYLDEYRFLDISKSIRGGIPILFPICGSLDSRASLFGNNYLNFMQHGFAREQEWEFQLNNNKRALSLCLRDNIFTHKYFPFKFSLFINVSFGINSLIFEIEIENKSVHSMPINFGLHPYFNISSFENIEYVGYPKCCLNQKNNSIEKTKSLLINSDKGIDLLMYTMGRFIIKDYGFRREITLRNPFPFDLTVLWSDPPRRMICVEPWTSPRNSLNNGIRKINIKSKTSHKLFTEIKIRNF